MRTQLLTGALAVIATTALSGLVADTASARTPDPTTEGTSRERGTLIECVGTAGAVPVRANIYQNGTHGNYLELLVNDGVRGKEAGATVHRRKAFVAGTRVRAAGKVGGHRMTISGTARPTGEVKRIRSVEEDAGFRIVSRGTHRLLAPALTVSYDGETGALTCDNAFRFDLKVTRTSVVD